MRFRDLRHTCITLLLTLGVPPHTVQAIAGHSHINVTMRIYAHANLDAMRDTMDRLDDRLDRARCRRRCRQWPFWRSSGWEFLLVGAAGFEPATPRL